MSTDQPPMSTDQRPLRPPDGIGDEHAQPIGGWRVHASPLSLVVFGAVLILALTGLLGREADRRAESGGVRLAVHSSEIIRNGEFFEMRIGVEADAPIGELVIGIGDGLWEDMTVNTMIPAASDEESAEGEFHFIFASLEAGTAFLLKIDLQVNPDIVGGNDGAVTVYDGDDPLATTDVSITVLP
jgi:hypothetical protein